MSEVLLEASGVEKSFVVERDLIGRAKARLWAVRDIDLVLRRGETLGLVGESGCGKSTLGRTLLRLYDADAGRIVFEGEDITRVRGGELRALRRRMQMIFQDPSASLDPRMTVGRSAAEPLLVHGECKRYRDAIPKVTALFDRVGLGEEHLARYPHELSGGQKQRVGIARALASNPSLIVADEPISALDVSIQAQVVNLLEDLQEERGLAYLFIAHDLEVVAHISDRVAVMYLGRIVEEGPAEVVASGARHPYTQALVAAIPRIDHASRVEAEPLTGDVPSPISVPPGCAFHTRCPYRAEVCERERPPLVTLGEGNHRVACHRTDEVPALRAGAKGGDDG